MSDPITTRPVRTGPRTRRQRAGSVVRELLPQGRLLPDQIWSRRHRGLEALLWLHVPALVLFGIARDKGVVHCLLEGQAIAAFAVVAGWRSASRMVRSIAASLGLVTCSAVLVHLWDGQTEGHFHFFVVLSLLILYQDWVPFLVAIAYVVVHHGLLGAIAPHQVYSNPAAAAHPWLWAMIHAGFVLAASAANLVSWRANEQLLRDPLTGLASRIVLSDRLERALAHSRRSGRPVALLFLDLDRFKLVNDSLGHTAGDRLLQLVSARLEESVRSSDTAARFGGDEFAVLCEDLDDVREAVLVAERIQAALAVPCRVNGHELATGASIGIATSQAGQQTAEELMRDADTAMYRAKERGKNRVERFDGEVRASLLRELELEADLRHALKRGELRLYFQAEVRLATGRIESVEALLRWEHPRRGLVPPLDFIPLAELTGLIIPIGTWVIQEACRQMRRWRTEGVDPGLMMRVNVSASQLADLQLRDIIARALADSDTSPERLCLEITESALVEDSEVAARVLTAIRELGVQLAVDDFGTGYSSLDRLRRFDVDVLKIDRAFVRTLNDSPDDTAIIDAIIAMAHALKLSVTAEGIEEPEQLATLRRLGCDAGQGFLFGRPAPADEILPQLMRDAAPAIIAVDAV